MKMKKTSRLLLVAGALMISAAPNARAQEEPRNDGIQWQAPSPEVNEAAKADNKIILADFYADWCGYCQKQDATAYEDDRVILMTDQLVATKINEENYRDLIKQYKVTSYPTVIIMSAGGEEVDRSVGAYSKVDDYVQWLGKNLYKNSMPNLKAALEKQPDDIKLLTIMALAHNAAGNKTQVPVLLEKAGDVAVAKFDAGVKIAPDKTGQMVRAFRLLSLYFQAEMEYSRAAASFNYLAQLSTRPREVLDARLALAENLYQSNQTPKAITELEAFLKLDGLTPEDKQTAQTKLASYKKTLA